MTPHHSPAALHCSIACFASLNTTHWIQANCTSGGGLALHAMPGAVRRGYLVTRDDQRALLLCPQKVSGFFFVGYKGGKIYWLAIHSNQANLIVGGLRHRRHQQTSIRVGCTSCCTCYLAQSTRHIEARCVSCCTLHDKPYSIG
jgi:hypothetical protein